MATYRVLSEEEWAELPTDRERTAAYMRDYWIAHRDELLPRHRAHYAAHPEMRAYKREWARRRAREARMWRESQREGAGA